MNKIPTAEKYFKEEFKIAQEVMPAIWYDLKLKAISFAKLHVKAALEAAAEKSKLDYLHHHVLGEQIEINKESIIKAYPETNII